MGESEPGLRIEFASERDVSVVLRMIRALAEYERLADEVTATEADLCDSLFGKTRGAEVLLAYVGPEPVGFAVFFRNYSTFLGRPGLYLEDLFVLPQWRRRGYGRRLLARVAAIAVEHGCGRLEWSVLDWNEPAIGFYKSLGAEAMDEWTVFRVTGNALQRLGADDGR